MNAPAALMMLVLKLPHSPLSAVTTMTSVRLSGPRLAHVEQRVNRRIHARGQAAEHALHLQRRTAARS